MVIAVHFASTVHLIGPFHHTLLAADLHTFKRADRHNSLRRYTRH